MIVKRWWIIAAALVVIAAVVVLMRPGPSGPVDLEELSVRFPIPVVENGQSPFYAAQDAGYYEGEGLSVTFEMGSPEFSPAAMVQSGADEIGVLGGPDTLLAVNSSGADLIAIAVLHRNSNFPVILTLASSHLTSVQDLEGRKMGFFYGHISTDVLRNFLRKTGVTVTEVDTGFDYGPLISGAVDAEWGFRVTAGLDLPARGVEVNMINPADAGVTSHGYTLFVRRDYLAKNRETLLKFLRATFKGIQLVVNDPQLGSDTITLRNPNADPVVSLERQKLYNEVTTGSGELPIGHMDHDMFDGTYQRLLEEGVVKPGLAIDSQFDRSLVDELDMFINDASRN